MKHKKKRNKKGFVSLKSDYNLFSSRNEEGRVSETKYTHWSNRKTGADYGTVVEEL